MKHANLARKYSFGFTIDFAIVKLCRQITDCGCLTGRLVAETFQFELSISALATFVIYVHQGGNICDSLLEIK